MPPREGNYFSVPDPARRLAVRHRLGPFSRGLPHRRSAGKVLVFRGACPVREVRTDFHFDGAGLSCLYCGWFSWALKSIRTMPAPPCFPADWDLSRAGKLCISVKRMRHGPKTVGRGLTGLPGCHSLHSVWCTSPRRIFSDRISVLPVPFVPPLRRGMPKRERIGNKLARPFGDGRIRERNPAILPFRGVVSWGKQPDCNKKHYELYVGILHIYKM